MVWLKTGISWKGFLSSVSLSIFVQSRRITISYSQNHLLTPQRIVNTLQVRIVLLAWVLTVRGLITLQVICDAFLYIYILLSVVSLC